MPLRGQEMFLLCFHLLPPKLGVSEAMMGQDVADLYPRYPHNSQGSAGLFPQ